MELRQQNKSWIIFERIDTKNIKVILPLLNNKELYTNLKYKFQDIGIPIRTNETYEINIPTKLELNINTDPMIFNNVFDIIILEYNFTENAEIKTRLYINLIMS